jgi:hypothetical protein
LHAAVVVFSDGTVSALVGSGVTVVVAAVIVVVVVAVEAVVVEAAITNTPQLAQVS